MKRSMERNVCGVLLGLVACVVSACSDSRTVAIGNQDDGKVFALRVGDVLSAEISSIGNQGEPAVSSAAVRYDGSSLVGVPNPGGPKIRYSFAAVKVGQATITIPFEAPTNRPPFVVDVNVE